jgi:hypothetical protein
MAGVRKSRARGAAATEGLRRSPRALTGSLAPASRPLALLPRSLLEEKLRLALRRADGAAGAHCIHELWMRGDFAASIEAALSALWQSAAATIPEWLPMRYVQWLPTVYEIALSFRATRPGRSNLYLVLLDFADRNRGPHGLYVGMSRYSPAQRFDQHKAGIHAAGSVLHRGIEVLTGPVLHLQHIQRAQALRIEAQLADALRDAGLLVEGGH